MKMKKKVKDALTLMIFVVFGFILCGYGLGVGITAGMKITDYVSDCRKCQEARNRQIIDPDFRLFVRGDDGNCTAGTDR